MSQGIAGIGGSLEAQLLRPPRPHKSRSIRLFGKRFIVTDDPGHALTTGVDYLQSHLAAIHRGPDGKVKDIHDLGSGNVQSNFVVALQADWQGTTNNHAAPILVNSGKYMYSGTGSTVTTYDVQLQTTAGPASGAITPTLGYAANGTAGTDALLTYVGTISYTSTLAITEWGLFGNNSQGALSTSTTNTWNAQGTATSTWGSAPSGVNAWAGYVAYLSSTTTGMFVIANSTATTASTITGSVSPLNAFYLLASSGGAGSTPSSNTSVSIYPLMTDHKTFGALNVVSGDSIQFTYTLRIVSGG